MDLRWDTKKFLSYKNTRTEFTVRANSKPITKQRIVNNFGLNIT